MAILPQFLAIEPHFVRKSCDWTPWNRNFTDRTSFRAKGLRGTTCKRQFYLSFWRSNLISCEKVVRDKLKSQQFLAIEPHFVRKGCVSCRLVGTAPRLQERKRKEGDGKRTRGEDVKMWGCGDEQMWGWEDVKMSRCEDEQMWRWEDVKMSKCEDVRMWRWEDVKMWRGEDEQMWRWEAVKMRRCEDVRMWGWEEKEMSWCEDERMWRCEDVKVKMWGCEDEKMWRWEDVRMRRCEDEKMWRWEDVLQTPTIGRTLRSDALGKKENTKWQTRFSTPSSRNSSYCPTHIFISTCPMRRAALIKFT